MPTYQYIWKVNLKCLCFCLSAISVYCALNHCRVGNSNLLIHGLLPEKDSYLNQRSLRYLVNNVRRRLKERHITLNSKFMNTSFWIPLPENYWVTYLFLIDLFKFREKLFFNNTSTHYNVLNLDLRVLFWHRSVTNSIVSKFISAFFEFSPSW